jgi:hypothetical protein
MKKDFFESGKNLTEIKLLLAGWCRKFPMRKTFVDVEHYHEFWQIDLCEKGSATLKVGDSRFEFNAGDIVIISPGLSHRFQYPAGQEFLCWSFKFDTPDSAAPQIVPVCDDESRNERIAIINALAEMCRNFFPENILNTHNNFAVSSTLPSVGILESLLTGIVRRWFFDREKEEEISVENTEAEQSKNTVSAGQSDTAGVIHHCFVLFYKHYPCH